MRKNTLAIFVKGCFVTGSSFATSLNMNNMFMKDPIQKSSSLTSKNHMKNTQSGFSGIWAGMCSHDGDTNEVKIRIEEDETGVTMADLMGAEWKETFYYNEIKTESNTNSDNYSNFTTRMSKVDDNTVKYERTGVYANQVPITRKEKALMVSEIMTSMMRLNHNQLTFEMNAQSFRGTNVKKDMGKCVLKRVG